MITKKLKTIIKKGLNKLNERFKRLSYRQQFIMVAFGCFAMVISSIYTLCLSVSGTEHVGISVHKISTPSHIVDSFSVRNSDSIIHFDEYTKIQFYEGYLDSLANSQNGKLHRDSILHDNPGLRDSLDWFINFYKSPLNR